jgi:subtilisin family serine protease
MRIVETVARVVAAIVVAGCAAGAAGRGAAQSAAVFIRLERETFDPLDGRRARAEEGGTAWLVQFVGPVKEEWKTALREAGGAPAFYIPDHAFLTRMDATTAERVRALPNVRWVGPWRPASRLAASVNDAPRLGLFDVQTFPDIDLGRLSMEIAALGGTVLSATDNGFAGYLRVQVAAAGVPAIAALDGVVWIEPHEAPETLNDRAVPVLRVPEAREELGLFGAGQIVAVADSGLDTGDLATLHPDFQGRVVKTLCLSRPDPCNWGDDNGHGTHVAGSVLGSGSASGARPAENHYAGSEAGVAPRAGLMVQAIGGPGTAILPPVDAGDLLRLAVREGAFIQTNSWGGGATGGYRLNAQQFDYALWQERGGLALVAAGNAGQDRDRSGRVDLGSISSPGTAKNVVTVGASENNRPEIATTYGQWNPFAWPVAPIFDDPIANRIDGMAAFSSRGPTADGRMKPDVVAPGTAILSTFSRISPLRGATASTAYTWLSGTSMATPLAAGSVALIREWVQTRRGIALPSGALLKAILVNGAEDMAPGQYGTTPAVQELPPVRPNPVGGFGRVNVQASVAPPGRQVWIADETVGLATGETWERTITTTGAGPLRATLAWADYPGQPGAAVLLVNDLDLELRGPNGDTHFGNAGAYPAGDRCRRGDADACNTVETVILPAVPAGTLTLRVRAYSIPQGGRQPFALVVSGAGIGEGPGQLAPPATPLPVATGRPCGDDAASGVYLYDLPGFAGKCSYFTADAPFADGWHIGNDAAQSLRILGPLTVVLWTDAAYQGRSASVVGPAAISDFRALPCTQGCVGPKEVSSLQVRARGLPFDPPASSSGDPHLPHGTLVPGNCDGNAGLYLYREPNFGGACTRLMLGDPAWFTGNANTWFIGNDAAQSLRLLPRGRTLDDGRFEPASGLRVTLYQDLHFRGLWTQITGTLVELPDLAQPPAGHHGPWIGAKTLSSARLEIVQLPGGGALPTTYRGGVATSWVPLAPVQWDEQRRE